MGQVLHGRATTTEEVRRAIQNSQESLMVLARRYGINPKTVAKWKKRPSVHDLPTGPKNPKSTVLSPEEEAMIVAFRRHTLLPLDDCLYSLQATIPHLSRSSLHRCLQRHGISRLPELDTDKPLRKKFKPYPIGYFHIDIAEVRTEEGKLYLFVAIDRTSKFAFVKLVSKAGKAAAVAFVRELIKAVPYAIHTILTDNGIQFTNFARHIHAGTHVFEQICTEHGIDHRLTKIKHPWTNGQVERMNRTIKEATVKRYHYDNHEQLKKHLDDFINAYNYGRRLKTLKGLTPYEFICKCWTNEPERFNADPNHKMLGPNNYAIHLADMVLVPVKPARPDVKGLLKSLKAVERVNALRERDIATYILLSDVDSRTKITSTWLDELKSIDTPMLQAQLLHRTGFREFMTMGGRLTGTARKVASEVLAEMQMSAMLDYYSTAAAAE